MIADQPLARTGTARTGRLRTRDIGEIAERSFGLADEKLKRLVRAHPGASPTYTDGGRWVVSDDPWAPNWSAGFVAGQMLILADHLGSEYWHSTAADYVAAIAPRRLDTSTHDIGFLFTPSWSRLRQREDTAHVRSVIEDAGRTMAGRFNSAGKYLCTWVGAGSTFIDIMMNVDIIWEAAEISGDEELAQVALEHSLTSRRYLVRGDGSTIHEGWFDPQSGMFRHADTHQGWRRDSTWARGHAWAIYGFGQAYLRTEDDRFLDTAGRVAEAYLERCPQLIPPNDLDEPEPHLAQEASAAAIGAAGLALLAEISHGPAAQRYYDAAYDTIAALSAPPFLSTDDSAWEGLIRRSTYHFKNNIGVDESVAWGDHYYLEAIDRLIRLAS